MKLFFAQVAICLGWSQYIATPSSAQVTINKPSELVLLRDNSLSCQILAVRETQLLRGTAPNAVHSTRLPTVDGEERLSFVSYDVTAIWNKARAMCKNDIPQQRWTEATDGLQHVLATTPYRKAPHLQISPLVVSGPSDNRVDLVFFADGCE